MKHIKLFEKFIPYSALNIGDVYITDKVFISNSVLDKDDREKLRNDRIEAINNGSITYQSLDYDYKRIIPEVKLINIDMNEKKEKLTMLAFFIDDEKEYIFNVSKSNVIRKATQEETEKFNLIQYRKKFNI